MDRNTITGMLLIMAMLMGYQYYMAQNEPPVDLKIKQAKIVKKVNENAKPIVVSDSAVAKVSGDFASSAVGQAQDIILENNEIKVILSSLGGGIKHVELKKYKSYANFEKGINLPLVVFKTGDKLSFELPTNKGNVDFSKLYFTGNTKGKTATFTLNTADKQSVSQTYTLSENGYELGYDLKLAGMDGNLKNAPIVFNWLENVSPAEKDLVDNRSKSTVGYLTKEDDFENLSEDGTNPNEETIDLPMSWVSMKKKYFVSGFIPLQTPISKAFIKGVPYPEDSVNLKTLSATMQLPIENFKNGKGNFKLYFGPNDLKTVKKVTEGFDRNVYLGYEVFKPINKYVFVPLFNFLEKIFSNYGLLIFVLVLIIKLVLTPLTYKSYVSMAKMKLLQPEINAIKERVGDDAGKLQQEQMKLYGQVGVSPMSGCVPVLATMPILMSVFFLFPNLMELRQQPFLWSNDLSTFDSIIKLPFNIPAYGSHISLFTILMTLSSLAYGYYNNQITPQQTGQPFDMRMMAYVTPIIFMFVMNSFPAGLSFYYFVSNIITVGQQLIIRKFVNTDKLQLVLDENRKKIAAGGGPKKSKFSEYLQKSLAQAEEAKKQAENTKKNIKSKK